MVEFLSCNIAKRLFWVKKLGQSSVGDTSRLAKRFPIAIEPRSIQQSIQFVAAQVFH